MMPAEYAAIGQPQRPAPFTLENLVSIATLVGGIFGNGGGDQLSNASLYENMKQEVRHERLSVPARRRSSRPRRPRSQEGQEGKAQAGKKAPTVDHSGFATFLSFDDPNDPEAPTTVHGKSVPLPDAAGAEQAVAKTIALPDPGSVQHANDVVGGAAPASQARSGPATPPAQATPAARAGPAANAGPGPARASAAARCPTRCWSAPSDSASGHPLAVMGPQVSYFAPQILMEEDIHGPGIDADGAAFPGVNLYVELGHGPDYAWSATSAGQNIIDTFAVPLCNPERRGGRKSL